MSRAWLSRVIQQAQEASKAHLGPSYRSLDACPVRRRCYGRSSRRSPTTLPMPASRLWQAFPNQLEAQVSLQDAYTRSLYLRSPSSYAGFRSIIERSAGGNDVSVELSHLVCSASPHERSASTDMSLRVVQWQGLQESREPQASHQEARGKAEAGSRRRRRRGSGDRRWLF